MSVRIAPSILASDFARLAEEVAKVEAAGAELIHVDVMDGHFVPNITIGPPVVKSLKKATTLPLDVHLMITDPDRYLDAFVSAGAAMLTVHVEVLPHLHRTLTRIRELGAKAGAAINPSTPVESLGEVTGQLDHVLVMSVNPGFGGQTFIERTYDKIRAVRALVGPEVSIGVDGGVDAANAGRLAAAGATVLVAGQSIFGAANAGDALRAIRAAAAGAAAPARR